MEIRYYFASLFFEPLTLIKGLHSISLINNHYSLNKSLIYANFIGSITTFNLDLELL